MSNPYGILSPSFARPKPIRRSGPTEINLEEREVPSAPSPGPGSSSTPRVANGYAQFANEAFNKILDAGLFRLLLTGSSIPIVPSMPGPVAHSLEDPIEREVVRLPADPLVKESDSPPLEESNNRKSPRLQKAQARQQFHYSPDRTPSRKRPERVVSVVPESVPPPAKKAKSKVQPPKRAVSVPASKRAAPKRSNN